MLIRKEKDTLEPPTQRGMQNGRDGGAAAAAEDKEEPTKRLRRPNVRLHQPYYENPGHRKLQQQWKAFKKDFEGAKRNRALKTVNVKGNKNNDLSDSSNDEEMEGFNFDDDVAIGSWKNFNACNRDRGFKSKAKRKRVRPSSSKKWASFKSNESADRENEKFLLSSGGESEKQGGEEENLGANGIDKNFEPENADTSSPYNSSGNDDSNDKLSDDNNNVGGNEGMQRVLRNGQDSDEMEGDTRMKKGESDNGRDGVKVWLNQIGLGKYAPLFEVHEVDDDVLPFLTLEDLKDMGISAVGSRRKMYNSIQNLSKGFFLMD